MLMLHTIKTQEQEYSAVAFIADWILANSEDGFGEHARIKARMLLLDDNVEVVGVVVHINDDKTKYILLHESYES